MDYLEMISRDILKTTDISNEEKFDRIMMFWLVDNIEPELGPKKRHSEFLFCEFEKLLSDQQYFSKVTDGSVNSYIEAVLEYVEDRVTNNKRISDYLLLLRLYTRIIVFDAERDRYVYNRETVLGEFIAENMGLFGKSWYHPELEGYFELLSKYESLVLFLYLWVADISIKREYREMCSLVKSAEGEVNDLDGEKMFQDIISHSGELPCMFSYYYLNNDRKPKSERTFRNMRNAFVDMVSRLPKGAMPLIPSVVTLGLNSISPNGAGRNDSGMYDLEQIFPLTDGTVRKTSVPEKKTFLKLFLLEPNFRDDKNATRDTNRRFLEYELGVLKRKYEDMEKRGGKSRIRIDVGWARINIRGLSGLSLSEKALKLGKEFFSLGAAEEENTDGNGGSKTDSRTFIRNIRKELEKNEREGENEYKEKMEYIRRAMISNKFYVAYEYFNIFRHIADHCKEYGIEEIHYLLSLYQLNYFTGWFDAAVMEHGGGTSMLELLDKDLSVRPYIVTPGKWEDEEDNDEDDEEQSAQVFDNLLLNLLFMNPEQTEFKESVGRIIWIRDFETIQELFDPEGDRGLADEFLHQFYEKSFGILNRREIMKLFSGWEDGDQRHPYYDPIFKWIELLDLDVDEKAAVWYGFRDDEEEYDMFDTVKWKSGE